MEEALNGKSLGVLKYLRSKQKVYRRLSVKDLWAIWIKKPKGKFDDFLREKFMLAEKEKNESL